jgi:hypothetical protein
MEYKNYEKWKAEGEKIQAEFNRVDEQRRQARIDGDNDTYVRLEDEYNRLLQQSRNHMSKMPLRSETPPKNGPPENKEPPRKNRLDADSQVTTPPVRPL